MSMRTGLRFLRNTSLLVEHHLRKQGGGWAPRRAGKIAWPAILGLVLAATLHASGLQSAAAQETAAQLEQTKIGATAERMVEKANLVVNPSKAGSNDISGTMQSASGTLSFDSVGRSSGKRGQELDQVVATLNVNGFTIVHTFDRTTGAVTIRTARGLTLYKRDIAVLAAFQPAFGQYLIRSGQADLAGLSAQTEAMWRLSEMYSEAPLGFTIPREWVVTRGSSKPLERQGAVRACEYSLNTFSDLHNQGDVCRYSVHLSRGASHDYCPQHGYLLLTTSFGCSASSCRGRCGAGCGLDGQGAWMHDCLRHDLCSSLHNNIFGGCADEFREAADDYARGPIHCWAFLGGCH